MRNLVCLISGRGSNLEAILHAQRRERWEQALCARMAAVISNRPGVSGLDVAREHGVAVQVLNHRDFASRAAFDAELGAAIEVHQPVLVVLAGFLRVLTPELVARFAGRMINIHPSLLPAFGGLDTHARALQAGVRVHGTTVHFVSGELDAGPIIAQSALAVDPGESEAELAARVLALEHELLPRCIRWLLEGRVRLDGRQVVTQDLDRRQLLTVAL